MIAEIQNADANSYVLLQLANRRFALHTFPHTSSLVSGVIVRRGRIVPVYDVASILLGRSSSVHRFYLIARRNFPEGSEATAIPVSGECELVTAELQEAGENTRPHISGRLLLDGESIEVLNFDALLASDPAGHNAPLRAETQP
jgi:chemotaxis signal transduction protein